MPDSAPEPVAPPASGKLAALVAIQSTLGKPAVIEVARADRKSVV